MQRRSGKIRAVQPNDLYTFRVLVSFEMQHTFTGNEVKGIGNEVEPTDKALQELEEELEEYIRRVYGIDKFEAYTDMDWLLGMEEDEQEPQSKKRLSTRPRRKK
jgi:hypothetical protein